MNRRKRPEEKAEIAARAQRAQYAARGIDREVDLHGYTGVEARAELNRKWPGWSGLQRVSIIHGTGDTLHALVRLWCEEKGVMWTLDERNTGVTIVHPGRQLQTGPLPVHRPMSVSETLHELRARTRTSKPDGAKPTASSGSAPSPGKSDSGNRSRKATAGPSRDLFAEEMQRLEASDPLYLHKSKHSLTPPPVYDEPGVSSADTRPDAENASRPRLDPMALAFERLGKEPASVTRRRKGDPSVDS